MAKVVKATREMMDVDQELKKLESKNEKKKTDKKEVKTEKKTTQKKTSKKHTKKKGIFQFFHEVRKEVSKVKWPSKKDMIKYSVATIVFILFFSVFFYLIELILALLKMGV